VKLTYHYPDLDLDVVQTTRDKVLVSVERYGDKIVVTLKDGFAEDETPTAADSKKGMEASSVRRVSTQGMPAIRLPPATMAAASDTDGVPPPPSTKPDVSK
jgi:hypothetical protein